MTIANMTMQELKSLINDTVDRRLREILGEFEIDDDEFFGEDEPDLRTWEEVKSSIKRNRWTPPPGTPSINQLLREDRDN